MKAPQRLLNLPNRLTILRIIMIPVFLVALLGDFGRNGYLCAAGIFSVAAFTDWLDGYIARKKNLVTNFGKFSDPLADKLLVAAALVAFVELSLIQAWIVIILISREFIVTGLRLIAVEKRIVLAADFWGKAKTAVQMVMIIYILIGFTFNGAALIKEILVYLSAFLSVFSAAEYTVKNRDIFIKS